eukprot:753030-Hanusia_phi.AAC.1
MQATEMDTSAAVERKGREEQRAGGKGVVTPGSCGFRWIPAAKHEGSRNCTSKKLHQRSV